MFCALRLTISRPVVAPSKGSFSLFADSQRNRIMRILVSLLIVSLYFINRTKALSTSSGGRRAFLSTAATSSLALITTTSASPPEPAKASLLDDFGPDGGKITAKQASDSGSSRVQQIEIDPTLRGCTCINNLIHDEEVVKRSHN